MYIMDQITTLLNAINAKNSNDTLSNDTQTDFRAALFMLTSHNKTFIANTRVIKAHINKNMANTTKANKSILIKIVGDVHLDYKVMYPSGGGKKRKGSKKRTKRNRKTRKTRKSRK